MSQQTAEKSQSPGVVKGVVTLVPCRDVLFTPVARKHPMNVHPWSTEIKNSCLARAILLSTYSPALAAIPISTKNNTFSSFVTSAHLVALIQKLFVTYKGARGIIGPKRHSTETGRYGAPLATGLET